MADQAAFSGQAGAVADRGQIFTLCHFASNDKGVLGG